MKMFKLWLLFSSIVLAICQNAPPIVKLPHGILQGAWKHSTKGRHFASFQGVPYARPPIGKYRFLEPQPLKRWTGVWDASTPAAECLQYEPVQNTVVGNESCLYLNVASPSPYANASLPVLLFIHGGAFMFGGGDQYDPAHLMDRDMVVVTINYRLGPLGFLSTGDQAAPGNAGLKDQAFALQWVKANIVMFGGNPDSITLTGNSAGGSSVHYHYLSPLSKGTFQKGITISGTAFAPWAFASKPLQNAKALAAIVGCPTSSTCEMVECLRRSPGEVIVNAQTKMFVSENWRVNLFTPFAPTTEPVGGQEKAFLTMHPYSATKAGKMADLPLITTVTSDEGLYPGAVYQTDPTILPELESRWGQLASYIFEYNDTLPLNRRPEVAAKIKQRYFDGQAISQETFPQLVQALGDRLFKVGTGKLAQLFAARYSKPIYVYRYAYRSSVSAGNYLSKNNNNYGVSHTDDLQMLMKFLPITKNDTVEDIKMREILIDLIFSFATTGIPKLPNGTEWIPVQASSPKLNYLNIAGPESLENEVNSDFGNRTFWDSLGFTENERYRKILLQAGMPQQYCNFSQQCRRVAIIPKIPDLLVHYKKIIIKYGNKGYGNI